MALRRMLKRPQMRTMLVFSTVIGLLCLIIVLYPLSTSVVQRTFQTHSIVVQTRRSEYYILNRNFFEFLSRTSMECLILVEPGEEWSGEAVVTTKLFDNDSGESEESTQPERGLTSVRVNPTNAVDSATTKYVLAYRHFEQLGKTTENLVQLAALAKHWGRYVVQPYAQNSRFSLERGFRTYPLDMYFNITSLNELLIANGYSQLVSLSNFTRDCSFNKFGVKTTLVHFLYSDVHRGNIKSWYHIGDAERREIIEKSLSNGWTECNFINKHLGVTNSLGGIEVGRQVCVNPEVVRNEKEFEDNVLRGDKCVILVEWRGLGKDRTHFHLNFLPFLTPAEVKHRISPSNLIDLEVIDFLQSKLPSKYISVHLRTEKLFAAHLYKKLMSCINHVVHLVNIVRSLRGVDTIFLATDLTDFGSDLFERRTFYKSNATGDFIMPRQEIANIHTRLAQRLNAVTYKPTRDPFSKDKGIVSLVEMNLLKRGIDLVTLGSGTFHAWVVSAFQQQHIKAGRRGYTISKVCSNGN